ncbi:MAG TPA: aldolase [Ensifer sp.]|jgi:citrate lyase beta subunit|uniref:aldolase n=1 Tax=Ensifer sp. TaxID=1872086 RepID=UPI002E0E3F63|nr:aldolase [Ensifer sp.]
MSVNRPQTIKPLLVADGTALSLDLAVLNAMAGIVLDVGCATETLRGLASRQGRDFALLARVEPVERLSEDELSRLLGCGIDGVVLTECRGRADIQRLDVMLTVAEAVGGMTANRTRIYAEYGGASEGLLSPHALSGSSARLEGLIFNGAALAAAVGCRAPTGASHERVAAPILASRAYVVLKAHEAGVPAYEAMPADCDEAAAKWVLASSRDNGFAAVVCRSVEQAIAVNGA